MNGKIFAGSFSWVIAAFLFVLAFFRGPEQPWLFAAIFAVWGMYLTIRILLPKVISLVERIKAAAVERKQKRAGKKSQPVFVKKESANKKQPAALIEGNELEHVLLGHVSCRISEKLRSAYPEATWQWDAPHPEAIIRGGTIRIKTSNTEDYTHAEVTVGSYYRISFKMMKIVDFAASVNPEADAEETDAGTDSEPKVVDVSVYYELVGREVLTNLISDLATRGHSSLHIMEDGAVYFTEGADEVKADELQEFPSKQYWPELAKCIEGDDLRVQLLDNRIAVAWG